jgi:hypothetical protein
MLEMKVEQTNVALKVTNYTGSDLMTSSSILGTAKRSNGDFYLIVTSKDGEVLPLCAMITTHDQLPPVLIRRDESAIFREDIATLSSVYCVGDMRGVSIAVEYREVRDNDSTKVYASNSVALDLTN